MDAPLGSHNSFDLEKLSDDVLGDVALDGDLTGLLDSFDCDHATLLSTIGDGLTMPPMPPTGSAAAVEPPPQVPPTRDPIDNEWKDLELYMEKHQVHKVTGNGTPQKEYIVSNLRNFEVTVVLMNRSTMRPSGKQLRLRAQLLYENSNPVKDAGDPSLIGDTCATVVNGRASFKLKMGKQSLSARHDHQRFRIKIEPDEQSLAASYPCLSQLTEPLKSITKLNPVKPLPASSASTAELPPQTLPDYSQTVDRPLPSLRPSDALEFLHTGDTAGTLSLAAEQAVCASNDLTFTPATASPTELCASTGGAVSSTSSALRFDMDAVAQEAQRQSALQADLARGQDERQSIQSIVDQQRRQIDELTRQNALILQELAQFRRQQGQS